MLNNGCGCGGRGRWRLGAGLDMAKSPVEVARAFVVLVLQTLPSMIAMTQNPDGVFLSPSLKVPLPPGDLRSWAATEIYVGIIVFCIWIRGRFAEFDIVSFCQHNEIRTGACQLILLGSVV